MTTHGRKVERRVPLAVCRVGLQEGVADSSSSSGVLEGNQLNTSDDAFRVPYSPLTVRTYDA